MKNVCFHSPHFGQVRRKIVELHIKKALVYAAHHKRTNLDSSYSELVNKFDQNERAKIIEADPSIITVDNDCNNNGSRNLPFDRAITQNAK